MTKYLNELEYNSRDMIIIIAIIQSIALLF